MAAKVLNLIGGPNTGKTTTALGLSYYMKRAGLRVKYVQEYATDMVYEERSNILADQLYLLAKQNRRLKTTVGRNDYIVMDSSLLLGLVYERNLTEEFETLIYERFHDYDNRVFYLPRDESFDYQVQGRLQTSHEECRCFDAKVRGVLPEGSILLNRGQDYIAQVVTCLGLDIDLTGPRPLQKWVGDLVPVVETGLTQPDGIL